MKFLKNIWKLTVVLILFFSFINVSNSSERNYYKDLINDWSKIFPDKNLSIEQGGIAPIADRKSKWIDKQLNIISKRYKLFSDIIFVLTLVISLVLIFIYHKEVQQFIYFQF